ncbi:conserved protein, unknown function [Hepatocystis sp. ex Piliocolobus tephrosceles]|nr:conserved protein, unknown function [Hepatocystis sp. ex Piliocolobus tephrosceles]
MNEPTTELRNTSDALSKLKEEREKLIQWSIKLKRNNPSLLNADKLDSERNEKTYLSSNESSDGENIDSKKKDIKKKDIKRNGSKKLTDTYDGVKKNGNKYFEDTYKDIDEDSDSLSESYIDKKSEYSEETKNIKIQGNKNQINIMDIRNKNKHMSCDSSISEDVASLSSSSSIHDSNNINNKGNKKNIKSYGANKNKWGENNIMKTNKYQKKMMHRTNIILNDKFDSKINSDNSNDSIQMNNLYDSKKKRMYGNNNNNNNMYDGNNDITNNSKSNYLNILPHIYSKKEFFDIYNNRNNIDSNAIIKVDEYVDYDVTSNLENQHTFSNSKESDIFDNTTLKSGNSFQISNLNNNEIRNKKKIKLIKKKSKLNNINSFLNTNTNTNNNNTNNNNNNNNNTGIVNNYMETIQKPKNNFFYDSNDNYSNNNQQNNNYNKLLAESAYKNLIPMLSNFNTKDIVSNTTLFTETSDEKSKKGVNSHDKNHSPSGGVKSEKRKNGAVLKKQEIKRNENGLKKKVLILENKKEVLNEQMKDLYDNTYSLIESKEKDNLTIHHYELLIQNLQTKYNKLFNMYQELDEHRIAYVDAYREKQTKVENLCAVMQIKSEENLKLTEEMNILNKKNEELQGQIYEYIKDIEEKEILLNRKKEECANLNDLVITTNKEKAEIKNELDKKIKEVNDLTNKNKNLIKENNEIKQKYSNYESKNIRNDEFYLKKVNNLLAILHKILEFFNLNKEDIIKYIIIFKQNLSIIEEKLKINNSLYDDILFILDNNIMNSIVDGIKNREQEYIEQKQNMTILFDKEILNVHEMNIENVELANDFIEKLKNKIKNVITQRDNIKNRTLLLSNGQGRTNDKPIIKEIKKMNEGTLLFKCKYKTFTHKPVVIYMKMIDNRYITWTKDVKNKKRFKTKNLLDIQNITSIEYGFNSRPVYWLIEKKNRAKLEKKQIAMNEFYNNTYNVNPCKCFTVRTKQRAYDFFSNDDATIATWVIGLGLLSYPYNKSANIQSKSEFIVKKVQLKLRLYCIFKNINYTELWKDAIEITQKEMLK